MNKKILYIVLFLLVIVLLALGVKVFRFSMLYLTILVPVGLFVALYFKNVKPKQEDLLDEDDRS